MRCMSVGVNLVGNLILIPVLGRYGYGHVGPPLATAVASTVNVWMLYHTLKKRGHFQSRSRSFAGEYPGWQLRQ